MSNPNSQSMRSSSNRHDALHPRSSSNRDDSLHQREVPLNPEDLMIGDYVLVLSSKAKEWVEAKVIASNSEVVRVEYVVDGDTRQKSLSRSSLRLERSVDSASKKTVQTMVGDVVKVNSTTCGGWVKATVMEQSSEAFRVHYKGVVGGEPVTLQKDLGYESSRFEIPKNCQNMEHDPQWGWHTFGYGPGQTVAHSNGAGHNQMSQYNEMRQDCMGGDYRRAHPLQRAYR